MKLQSLLAIGVVMVATKLVLAQTPAPSAEPATRPSREVYRQLADQMDSNLKTQILDKWFPGALNDKGGFLQNYAEDWTPQPNNSSGIVYQSRLTWTAAQAIVKFPDQAALYLAQTRHGLTFLGSTMWDAQAGGFYWAVDNAGHPANALDKSKQAYGNAFGMYAAAANFKITHDPAALELAKKAFTWMDEHLHDKVNGGYLEIPADTPVPLPASPVGARPGQKSMNSSIHILEALATLYEVWPDPTVKSRLQEMFEIARDRIVVDPGYLVQFFSADWKPATSPDSYGHDVEAGYLITDAAAVLGIPDDPKAWAAAKKLVDHSLAVAVDHVHGGLYNDGTIAAANTTSSKDWWVEAEFLNALLMLHDRYGSQTPRYWDAFITQYYFIMDHEIDKTHGGWYPQLRADSTPTPRRAKSDQWTECYHQGRAVMNVAARLKKLAGE